MGTDINAAFGHRVPFPPTESVVEGMRKGIHPVSPYLGREWRLIPNYNIGYGLAYVTEGLGVYFGPHSAIISTGYRWPRPEEDVNEKESLITAICAIAGYFESPRVIFLPSSTEPWNSVFEWVGEGFTLDQLQQRLIGIREPSATFQATLKLHADYYEINGYVIRELDHKTAPDDCK